MMVAPRLFLVLIFSILFSTVEQKRACAETPPKEVSIQEILAKIRTDSEAKTSAAVDFGQIIIAAPVAVFFPSSTLDVSALLRLSNESPRPFQVAPRGQGHSVRGQAAAPNGVVVNMSSLGIYGDVAIPARRIRVSSTLDGNVSAYVDVGAEQLWIDVLNETLKHGLAPKSWTDYLYLTVGGTLSNAGISGQSFRHGPQISNVYDLDVITGKGEIKTCSKELNSDLFYAVLGGLGQFGVITRARIALEAAPDRVIWVKLIYTNFTAFTSDQEHLIAIDRRSPIPKTWSTSKGFDFIEGFVLLDTSPTSSWRSSFSPEDSARIEALITQNGPVYSLEAGMYYDHVSKSTSEKDVEKLLERLNFVPGMAFTNDVSYVRFLDRVREEELLLRSLGLWNVPHPWLNLFVPGSRISDINSGVFRGILRKNPSKGPILVYPLIRDRWDERTSVVIPEEPVFYIVALLSSAVQDDLKEVEDQNEAVLRYCKEEGIKAALYLPHYREKSDWVKHFGAKWRVILERKRRYDPKMILSPGQGIFNSPGF